MDLDRVVRRCWCVGFCCVVILVCGVECGVVRGGGAVPEPAAAVAGRSAAAVELRRQAPLPAYCGPCDRRACPLITPDSCPGRVVKDPCDCCPICDLSAITIEPPTNSNQSKYTFVLKNM